MSASWNAGFIGHEDDDSRIYRGPAVEQQLRQCRLDELSSVVYMYGGRAASTQCDCDSCRHCSTSTSLYPMIGSCTTSSCHVDARPRPPPPRPPPQPPSDMFVDGGGSAAATTDCSTCCVYEYALDLDSLRSAELSGSERTVDCGSAVKGASLSWLTVHSAPAVLGRLARYRLPAAASRRHLQNRTTARDDHCRRDDARDGFCGCRSPVYRTDTACYQPVPYTYRCATAAAAAAAADDDDDDVYRRLSPSLRLAKPVLAETQYWV